MKGADMPVRLVDPRDERRAAHGRPAARLPTLIGRSVALVDISKPGGSVFLDRLALRLQRDSGVARLRRVTKPAFAKRAPAELLDGLRGVDAVVLALAD